MEVSGVRLRIVLLVLAIPVNLFAGDEPARVEPSGGLGTLGITGTEGARLEVDGDSVGSRPLAFLTLPLGDHEVRLSKRGYESRTERIRLSPLRGETRAIYLHAKRKRDALWRNLLVPGWGVAYGDHRTRGLVTLLVEAGMLGYAYYEDGRFHDRRDDYEAADIAYRRAVTDEAIAAARAERDDAYDRMESSESNRDGALIAAAVVYGLSALDAILSFPYDDSPDERKIVFRSAFTEGGARAWIALRSP
jgi:hypothetical protein